MTFINPLAGALAQSTQVARQQSVEKAAQVKRQQVEKKNAAADDDVFEHVVESTEEVSAIGEDAQHEAPSDQRKSRKGSTDEEPEDDISHLDITA